jgi:hypothetical protein
MRPCNRTIKRVLATVDFVSRNRPAISGLEDGNDEPALRPGTTQFMLSAFDSISREIRPFNSQKFLTGAAQIFLY